jgi:hypothetical protein
MYQKGSHRIKWQQLKDLWLFCSILHCKAWRTELSLLQGPPAASPHSPSVPSLYLFHDLLHGHLPLLDQPSPLRTSRTKVKVIPNGEPLHPDCYSRLYCEIIPQMSMPSGKQLWGEVLLWLVVERRYEVCRQIYFPFLRARGTQTSFHSLLPISTVASGHKPL